MAADKTREITVCRIDKRPDFDFIRRLLAENRATGVWCRVSGGIESTTKLNSFRDLRVYEELRQLHLIIHEESLRFPKLELYELGSQIRRSSNSAPANVAEGWGSRYTNVHIEAISRALGEVQETHTIFPWLKTRVTSPRHDFANWMGGTRSAAGCSRD